MPKKKYISIAKTILPLLLGVFLIFYSIGEASPEERTELWKNITQANPFWLLLSVFLGCLSHLSRAYRWQYLLQPMGYKTNFKLRFMAIMAGYLANMGIPRSGEVLRAASLSTYQNIPFEKSFGTIISERVADLVMLLIILGGSVIFNQRLIINFLKDYNINPFFTIMLLSGLLLFGLLGLQLLKKTKHPLLQKIKNFGQGILEGMKSIFQMKYTFAFLAHTIFIWAMYICMFFVVKFAIPETTNLSFNAIMAAFVVGSFAISITNGGIGVYPIAVGAILVFFGINKEAGEAFGWVVWGTQTLLNLVLGGLSLLLLPVIYRK